MTNTLLYLASVFIWGTTWIAIKLQLGVVPAELSVSYRFALASLLLFVVCGIRGLSFRFTWREHFWIALQGIFLFCLAYIFQYHAAGTVTSGVMAVVFSTVIAFNIVNNAIFLRAPIHARVVWGAILGLLGIALVFWNELEVVPNAHDVGKGFMAVLIATLFASFGNIVSARNQKNKIPITQSNAFGMGYAALLVFLYAMLKGLPITFEFSSRYVLALLYLSIFGSVVAFGCYLKLLGRIGPDRAAYIAVLFPLVALVVSTLFENYQWTSRAGMGVLLILMGNIVVLKRHA